MPQGRDRNINEYTASSDYEVPVDVEYVYGNATAGNIVITLKRTKDKLLRWHKVKKIDAGANTVTVTDGTLSYVLATQNDAAIFEMDRAGLFSVYGSSNGSGATPSSVSMETPTGDIDGVNDEFVFTVAPIAVYLNQGLQYDPADYSVVGATVTFNTPPNLLDQIRGLVQT